MSGMVDGRRVAYFLNHHWERNEAACEWTCTKRPHGSRYGECEGCLVVIADTEIARSREPKDHRFIRATLDVLANRGEQS